VGKGGRECARYQGVGEEEGGGGAVESSHILTGSFRANKNGCRVSRGKDGQCGGYEEARARGLKEGGDGEERVR
jgi:hypothetical protein